MRFILPKGQKILSNSKTTFDNKGKKIKLPTFVGVEIPDYIFYSFYDREDLFVADKDLDGYNSYFDYLTEDQRKHCRHMSTSGFEKVRTFKAFKRLCKKKFSHLPKGTRITLESRAVGNDIICII